MGPAGSKMSTHRQKHTARNTAKTGCPAYRAPFPKSPPPMGPWLDQPILPLLSPLPNPPGAICGLPLMRAEKQLVQVRTDGQHCSDVLMLLVAVDVVRYRLCSLIMVGFMRWQG